MNKIILNIQDYLNQLSSAKDQSITRLISSLEKRRGFGRIQLLNDPAKPIELSIQHDPNIITTQQITRITQTMADSLNEMFGNLQLKADDWLGQCEPKEVLDLFKKCSGVIHVHAEPNGRINLEFNRYITQEARLLECINQHK